MQAVMGQVHGMHTGARIGNEHVQHVVAWSSRCFGCWSTQQAAAFAVPAVAAVAAAGDSGRRRAAGRPAQAAGRKALESHQALKVRACRIWA